MPNLRNKEIVLGTSIAPRNIDNQISAIKSWVKSGFKVVSCNVREEIDVIEPYFKDTGIEFAEVECDINSIREVPLPYIDDILEVVGNKAEQVCGYINSDIYLENVTDELYDYMYNEAEKSLLIVRRNDIEKYTDIQELNWKMHDGVDMFLLNKDFISTFSDHCAWVQSCWDMYILLKAHIMDIPIEEIMNPIAFHKKHVQKWNFRIYKYVLEAIWEKYYGTKEKAIENATAKYYTILFEACRQVCFLKREKFKCLFVLTVKDDMAENSIREQEFLDSNMRIQMNDEGREEYDYVFYIPPNTILSPVFCKTVIFIMRCYNCTGLEIGKFFICNISGKKRYTDLSKNINLLEDIHRQIPNAVLIHANNKKNIYMKLIYPIAHENINFDDSRGVLKCLKLTGRYYIAPAGIRANWWFNDYAYKLTGLQFVGFLDNNKRGSNIYPMNSVGKDTDSYVFIASRYYFKEILSQLHEIIDEDRLILTSYICCIGENGEIYYFDFEQYKKSCLTGN